VTAIYTSREAIHYLTQPLTEKHITKTDRNCLGLEVVVQRRLTQLAPNTRLLVATEWQRPVESVVRVDPDSSRTERVSHLDGRVEVGGVDSGGKTVRGRVGNLDDLGLALELGDCADGAENFFLLDLHVFGDVGEDGGLNEVPLVALAFAARLNRGTRLLTLLDIAG
jgi:hypothetical protein